MGLNLNWKTIKLLEDNTGENIGNIEFGNEFFGITPKAWSMPTIIDKLYFIKLKFPFCERQVVD